MTWWRPWEPLRLPPYIQQMHEQALQARLAYEDELKRQEETLRQLAAMLAIDPRCEWLSKAERNRLAWMRWMMDRQLAFGDDSL